MGKSKKIIIQALICVGLICVIWAGYFLAMHFGAERGLDIKEDNFSWVYQVDSVKTEGQDFVLRGFAFKLGEDAAEGGFEIVLRDIESGKKTFSKMEYFERKDVNEYFLCEYDYMQSGFSATIALKKLDLEKRGYEVLLREKGKQQTYQTGVYVSGGELVYANPLNYVPLDVEGTGLEEVVNEGILRVYRPDYGVYIYQYEGDLYWIVEKTYNFDNSGDMYMEYQLATTQIDRLPEYRLKNKWYWDNVGFMFADKEVEELETEKYRVSRKGLPTEYSIEKIWTGENNGEWIWTQTFRPYYRMK